MTPRTSVPTATSTDTGVPAPRSGEPSDRPDAGGPAPRAASPDRAPSSSDAACTGMAWIVREITHVPGMLRLRDGRLSFVSTRGVLFDAPVEDLSITLGRTHRGFRVTVDGEELRLRVVRPGGGVVVPAELMSGHDEAGDGPATTGDAGAGTTWRGLLAPFAHRRAGLRGLGWCSARSRPASGERARTY